jgi:hypothetical protein
MTCHPSKTPPLDGFDIPALREKYRYERDKRLLRKGGEQYVRPAGEFAGTYEHDPHMPAWKQIRYRNNLRLPSSVAVGQVCWLAIICIRQGC